MARIGVGFSGGPNASEIVDCVKLAESLGHDSAWVAEGHGGDQFAVLNGRSFDIPVLKYRAMVHGVPSPSLHYRDYGYHRRQLGGAI